MPYDDYHATHPSYDRHAPDWETLRDVHEGERKIKERGETYLPATSGQVLDGMGVGMLGYKKYNAYRMRAVFPDLFAPTVTALCGVMHRNPSEVKLPKSMEDMEISATPRREGVQSLNRMVSCELLTVGRYGLLVDPPENGTVNDDPRIVGYRTESILNWEEVTGPDGVRHLSFVVLDESRHVRNGFKWTWRDRCRVLELDESGTYTTYTIDKDENGEALVSDVTAPQLAGRTLDRIPFVFANPTDLSPEPDRPPLLSLARLSLAIYRGEADYRHALFMTANDTLVILGQAFAPEGSEPDQPIRIGGGSSISLEKDGDAKFIGVSSTGLSEQRQALENDYDRAAEQGSQLLRTQGGTSESGEALRIRLAAQTATIATISMASAGSIESALKIAAKWSGASEDDVMFDPNLDFSEDDLESASRAILNLVAAKSKGAPISDQSIHRVMLDTDLTMETFEEEMKRIASEKPAVTPPEPPIPGAVPPSDA